MIPINCHPYETSMATSSVTNVEAMINRNHLIEAPSTSSTTINEYSNYQKDLKIAANIFTLLDVATILLSLGKKRGEILNTAVDQSQEFLIIYKAAEASAVTANEALIEALKYKIKIDKELVVITDSTAYSKDLAAAYDQLDSKYSGCHVDHALFEIGSCNSEDINRVVERLEEKKASLQELITWNKRRVAEFTVETKARCQGLDCLGTKSDKIMAIVAAFK